MQNEELFSTITRQKQINELNNKNIDLLVVGGGITGAGIALDAASRGLKVLLIEKNDFAAGTSSRSTKLIHGGLRYLEKLQFKFVAQLGRERKILHNNCTHNIIPTPVILPIIKNGQLNKYLTYCALFIYDVLAVVSKQYKAKWLKRNSVLNNFPLLNTENLIGAFKYYEYKTNDGRLVIETLKTAVGFGAICLNKMELQEFTHLNGKINGAAISDLITKQQLNIKAKKVVNATGVWCEKFADRFDVEIEKKIYPTKGIHLVFSKSRFPIETAYYFDTDDNRMVFAIPRQNHIYVGTTDTPYEGSFEKLIVENNDVEYILKAVNEKFINLQLTADDVVSCWAGLRPLLLQKGKKPGEISRKEELFISETGLITITGGKLTGYRLMAKKVVNKVMSHINKGFVKCKTHNIKLSGSNWQHTPSVYEMVEMADHKYDEAKQTGIENPAFKKLFYRYGTNIDIITEKAYEYLNQNLSTEQVWLKAELYYAVNFEMLVDVSGFCIYRTEMVLFENQIIEKHINFIAECLGEFLSWNLDEQQQQKVNFFEEWEQYKSKKTK